MPVSEIQDRNIENPTNPRPQGSHYILAPRSAIIAFIVFGCYKAPAFQWHNSITLTFVLQFAYLDPGLLRIT